MEKYVATCRLILCVNSTSRVIPAIKSRCLGIRVASPTHDEIVAILNVNFLTYFKFLNYLFKNFKISNSFKILNILFLFLAPNTIKGLLFFFPFLLYYNTQRKYPVHRVPGYFFEKIIEYPGSRNSSNLETLILL